MGAEEEGMSGFSSRVLGAEGEPAPHGGAAAWGGSGRQGCVCHAAAPELNCPR